jgi:hypothetical protein
VDYTAEQVTALLLAERKRVVALVTENLAARAGALVANRWNLDEEETQRRFAAHHALTQAADAFGRQEF